MKRFPNENIRNSKVIVRFLPVHFVFYEKIAIFAVLTESSLRHCRIKRGKETRSFLIRSPFDIYPSQTSKNQVFTICEIILLRDYRLPHGGGRGCGSPRQERGAAQHTAYTAAGGVHREVDGVRQVGRRHDTRQGKTIGDRGKSENADRNGLCPQDGARYASDRFFLVRRPPGQQGEPLCENDCGVLSQI